MDNIFKDAYFGKAYKTRDGRKALFYNCGTERSDVFYKYFCVIENYDDIYEVYDSYGRCNRDDVSPIDIISEWREEVNEEELDKLAEDIVLSELRKNNIYIYKYNDKEFSSPDLKELVKAGYHKSKEK